MLTNHGVRDSYMISSPPSESDLCREAQTPKALPRGIPKKHHTVELIAGNRPRHRPLPSPSDHSSEAGGSVKQIRIGDQRDGCPGLLTAEEEEEEEEEEEKSRTKNRQRKRKKKRD